MIKRIVTLTVFLALFLSLGVQAAEPYSTYTYSYSGEVQKSPDAFFTQKVLSGTDMGTTQFSGPKDIITDADGNVYVADTKNNRVAVFNSDFKFIYEIKDFEYKGNSESFNLPSGLFSDGENLYVADTENSRIVIFKRGEQTVKNILEAPETELMKGLVYKPIAVSVDESGRLYVVGQGINQGVVALESNGNFSGFLGAKRVNANLVDLFWRMFMSKEQIARMPRFVPTEYNNIAIDDQGFLYVTSSSISDWEAAAYMASKSRSDLNAPVKRLNPTGVDVMRRFGFYPPGGDAEIEIGIEPEKGPSRISDVAVTDFGVYTVLDTKRNKTFTYDIDGNLLYAFGASGSQFGASNKASSIAYMGKNLLLLDEQDGKVTVFEKTEYGKMIDSAIELSDKRKYEESLDMWREVVRQNGNQEMVYSAIGQVYMRQEKYDLAMESFKKCNDIENYSISYSYVRKESIRKNIWFLLLGAAVLIFLLARFFKYEKKVNNAELLNREKRSLKSKLLYGFYFIYHPFNASYSLKTEKRGSILSATVILIVASLSMAVKSVASGFIASGGIDDAKINLLTEMTTVLAPFALFVIANWCLTTLMDGEARMKDIYITTAYALFPIAITAIPLALVSNFLTLAELPFIDFIMSAVLFWTFLLIFFGIMVAQDFSLTKNIVTILLTIVGMLVLMFIGFLFFNLINKMMSVISNVYREITFRF